MKKITFTEEEKKKVFNILSCDWVKSYDEILEKLDEKIPKNKLKKIITELKENKIVKMEVGFCEDTGLIAGRGFCRIDYKKVKELGFEYLENK